MDDRGGTPILRNSQLSYVYQAQLKVSFPLVCCFSCLGGTKLPAMTISYNKRSPLINGYSYSVLQ